MGYLNKYLDTGTRADKYTDNSLYGLLKQIVGMQKTNVYPSLTDAVNIVTGSSTWVLGAFGEFVPTGAINKAFKVQFINTAQFSANNITYEIVLYAGGIGQEVEIGRTRANGGVSTGSNKEPQMPIMSPILPAGTRISYRAATNRSSVETCIASIIYFTYE